MSAGFYSLLKSRLFLKFQSKNYLFHDNKLTLNFVVMLLKREIQNSLSQISHSVYNKAKCRRLFNAN